MNEQDRPTIGHGTTLGPTDEGAAGTIDALQAYWGQPLENRQLPGQRPFGELLRDAVREVAKAEIRLIVRAEIAAREAEIEARVARRMREAFAGEAARLRAKRAEGTAPAEGESK
jgi:hypothetical protein